LSILSTEKAYGSSSFIPAMMVDHISPMGSRFSKIGRGNQERLVEVAKKQHFSFPTSDYVL
jgi:hypothetical protein